MSFNSRISKPGACLIDSWSSLGTVDLSFGEFWRILGLKFQSDVEYAYFHWGLT